jgi:uncharacterized membrane protein (UPF0127 family)
MPRNVHTQGSIWACVVVDVIGETIQIEVAYSVRELQTGLMNRGRFQENSGMLFIIGPREKIGFWMKDMNFPIDIIWLDSSLKVVDITSEAVPCKIEPCTIYTPSVLAKYALEVPAGFAQKNLIETGQSIVF